PAGAAGVGPGGWERARPPPPGGGRVAAGVGVDPAAVGEEVSAVLAHVLEAAGLAVPDVRAVGAHSGLAGRDGRHTEALSRMLAEMQSVARAHPRGAW
ncbi:MAG: Phenylacetic acid catabolic protein, partial [Marmoricola sp.]